MNLKLALGHFLTIKGKFSGISREITKDIFPEKWQAQSKAFLNFKLKFEIRPFCEEIFTRVTNCPHGSAYNVQERPKEELGYYLPINA